MTLESAAISVIYLIGAVYVVYFVDRTYLSWLELKSSNEVAAPKAEDSDRRD